MHALPGGRRGSPAPGPGPAGRVPPPPGRGFAAGGGRDTVTLYPTALAAGADRGGVVDEEVARPQAWPRVPSRTPSTFRRARRSGRWRPGAAHARDRKLDAPDRRAPAGGVRRRPRCRPLLRDPRASGRGASLGVDPGGARPSASTVGCQRAPSSGRGSNVVMTEVAAMMARTTAAVPFGRAPQ